MPLALYAKLYLGMDGCLTMQFVKNGPDIPEQLLQAHEEGKVVFFCGAGISYPADLPGFKGLVDKIYDALGTTREGSEERAYDAKHFDATLDLLERRIAGQRIAVRTKLADSLKPNYRKKAATKTHEAILELAKCGDGAVRLVTTNFDRIFQRVIERDKLDVPCFPAPLLPIPKNSRWNGIVYLHGLLPEGQDDGALHRLVLTSGDFGLAYLTERWAARFVSELFRNYVVCFIGYTIDDPVLRYMMDALAADRMLGEVTPQAYAFGECKQGMESAQKESWDAKGVFPILYRISANGKDHSALHGTLLEWSKTYRDGALGKEQIVVEYANARPMVSTQEDNFVGRMLWALSHKSALPAKRFADFDPVPSLNWLAPLSDQRYQQADLIRFGVPPLQANDDKLTFSIVRRPSPYTHSTWMALAHAGQHSSLDDVMGHLARWLSRHLDDPELILWVADRGGQLHPQFTWIIESKLEEIARLESAGEKEAIKRLQDKSPNAIPRPLLRSLWRLMLAGCIKSPLRHSDLYSWHAELKRTGLSATLRIQLRAILAPQVSLRKPFQYDAEDELEGTPERPPIETELVLASDHVQSALTELGQSDSWRVALPVLLRDLEQLLRDALDIQRELGDADERRDRSYWDLPSISPHWQNKGFHDWVSLVELLRDSWLETRRHSLAVACRAADDWWFESYPTFKRLALFAASNDGIKLNGGWVEWLEAEDGWWLWSVQTQREVLRLIVVKAHALSRGLLAKLEELIIAGPPRRMFREGLSNEEWNNIVERMVWLRLAKLGSTGVTLRRKTHAHFEHISRANSRWRLADNERDEFSHWMSGTGDPDFEDVIQHERAPRDFRGLKQWLLKPVEDQFYHEDDWRIICREKLRLAVRTLASLAADGEWPIVRWEQALQVWSEEKSIKASWHLVAPVLQRIPEDKLIGLAHPVAWWLEAAAKSLKTHRNIFMEICARVVALPIEDSPEVDQPTQHAINHPIGQVTQALITYWLKQEPTDGQKLPQDLEIILTNISDVRVRVFRHGRVILASNVIPLYRVDRVWTSARILPLFKWSRAETEARAAWEGFLWSPRLYRPLMLAFKADFLETAKYYDRLDNLDRQYAGLLTYAALDRADTFSVVELSNAMHDLRPEGLVDCAQALLRSLEGAGEKSSEFWTNRVEPYWQAIWPKARKLASPALSEQLAKLAIAAGESFPRALTTLKSWIVPFDHPGYLIHKLKDSRQCSSNPKSALTLLDLVIPVDLLPVNHLAECLAEIEQAWAGARDDARFRRLREIVRRRGG